MLLVFVIPSDAIPLVHFSVLVFMQPLCENENLAVVAEKRCEFSKNHRACRRFAFPIIAGSKLDGWDRWSSFPFSATLECACPFDRVALQPSKMQPSGFPKVPKHIQKNVKLTFTGTCINLNIVTLPCQFVDHLEMACSEHLPCLLTS